MEPSLTDSLLAGIKLMLIGMGIVYLFLSLLVGIISLTSRLLQKFSSELEGLPARHDFGVAAETEEAEVVAVISAALQGYRYRQTD
jgi:oxaloacetate decarboxylase gamma subunit